MSDSNTIGPTTRPPGRVQIPWRTVGKLGIGAGLVCILALLFPKGETIDLEFKVGSVWARNDLIAPFSFPVFRDERAYQKDVDTARAKVLEVFERDTAAMEIQVGQLRRFFSQVSSALTTRTGSGTETANGPTETTPFGRRAFSLNIPLTEKEWETLNALSSSGGLSGLQSVLTSVIRANLSVGIIDRAKNSIGRDAIAVRNGHVEEIAPVSRFYDQNDLAATLERQLSQHYRGNPSLLSLAYKIAMVHLAPDVRFSQKSTDEAMSAAADAVPRTIGYVQENERIVSKHERITEDIRLKLESLRRMRVERGAQQDRPSQWFGALMHVAILIALFSIYLTLFRKQIIANNRRLALLAILILFQGVLAYLTREMDVNAPLEYLILVPVSAMLLTILFDSRVGFYGTVMIAFLVAGIRGNDYSVALASLAGGAIAVYTVRDMKNRTQIFRSLGYIFLGYSAAIIALGLERYEAIPAVAEQVSYALVNAVISPVMTYGLLIFLERVFRVTTDLALIELAQFNHPLLRMLSERAPGTYHHSITMASLAEAGAAAVGANEVLARVGAYFHDVGKLIKPTYFVENQKGSRNRHEKLAPRMSSLIIASHVKDGIALAREYRLPEEIIEFIPAHHGTTRMDFFYDKAVQLANSSPDETKIDEIKEQDYRYPGPKPQTKETGIMMLADTVEAAVRSLEDPNPQRMEETINDLVRKRFEEGELDDCPLTLKDLTKIKAAFLTVMVGMYHPRPKYPEPEAKKPKVRRSKEPPPPPEAEERLARTIREIDGQ